MVCFLFAWRSGILQRCTSGQSPSAHAGIPRLLVPPSARSQIGDIRPGNDVSARASVNAAPRFVPEAAPAHANRRRSGRAPSRAALCRGTPGLPAPLPPPRRAPGQKLGERALPASGSAGHAHGFAGSAHLPAARSRPRARSGRGAQAGPQRGQRGSGARDSAFAASERGTAGLGLSLGNSRQRPGQRGPRCPGEGRGLLLKAVNER